ncbi:tRNA (N6-threonylcarbamoyladenosine(37)-N6)-methyltransferase TrmO [Microbispora sp. NPDC049125]|uniref:tRNA (N6-threonylcarbamoyladenosine(37)-N6)-methyltransferase TrmO n=1 Tax=Microbispora sp. NPDC049125 TaxID=3154929 RepID=UPI00346591EB
MNHPETYEIHPVGVIRSPLRSRSEAPKQGDEGAPDAWLEIGPAFAEALDGVAPGAEILILTWFHEADRDALTVRPRGDATRRMSGVFATRSPDRPNPIGLHRVTVVGLEGGADGGSRVLVRPLEAIDGTPVVDVKPVLDAFDR